MFLGLNRNISLLIVFVLIPIAIIYQLIKQGYQPKQDSSFNMMSEINKKLDMIIRENITAEKIQSMLDQNRKDIIKKVRVMINDSRKDIIKKVRVMINDSVFILQHKRAFFTAELSSGKIEIYPKSKDGNQYACGTLIKYNIARCW